jgi:hypothetical protein
MTRRSCNCEARSFGSDGAFVRILAFGRDIQIFVINERILGFIVLMLYL